MDGYGHVPVLTPDAVISVEAPVRRVLSVEVPPRLPKSVVVVRGPKGDQGPAGAAGSGIEIVQSTPAATWILAVPPELGRTPAVAVFVAGEQVFADVTADANTVSIQFPNPTAGSAVLT